MRLLSIITLLSLELSSCQGLNDLGTAKRHRKQVEQPLPSNEEGDGSHSGGSVADLILGEDWATQGQRQTRNINKNTAQTMHANETYCDDEEEYYANSKRGKGGKGYGGYYGNSNGHGGYSSNDSGGYYGHGYYGKGRDDDRRHRRTGDTHYGSTSTEYHGKGDSSANKMRYKCKKGKKNGYRPKKSKKPKGVSKKSKGGKKGRSPSYDYSMSMTDTPTPAPSKPVEPVPPSPATPQPTIPPTLEPTVEPPSGPPPFDITRCAAYALEWLIDLQDTCVDFGTLEGCECATAEALFQAGDITCAERGDPSPPACPDDCEVCKTCLVILGCEDIYDTGLPPVPPRPTPTPSPVSTSGSNSTGAPSILSADGREAGGYGFTNGTSDETMTAAPTGAPPNDTTVVSQRSSVPKVAEVSQQDGPEGHTADRTFGTTTSDSVALRASIMLGAAAVTYGIMLTIL